MSSWPFMCNNVENNVFYIYRWRHTGWYGSARAAHDKWAKAADIIIM